MEYMLSVDLVSYLPDDILVKVDRAAMAIGLETRIPMLDHRVVEFAFSLPLTHKVSAGQNKRVLRNVLYKYVPKELVERPKMGFAVPISLWLRGPLRSWAEGLLDRGRLREQGYLDANLVQQNWREHLAGEVDAGALLWNLLTFQSWLDVSVDAPEPLPIT